MTASEARKSTRECLQILSKEAQFYVDSTIMPLIQEKVNWGRFSLTIKIQVKSDHICDCLRREGYKVTVLNEAKEHGQDEICIDWEHV